MRTSNSTVRTLPIRIRILNPLKTEGCIHFVCNHLFFIGVICFCIFKRICKFITWIWIHNDFILYVRVFLLQTEVFCAASFLIKIRYLADLCIAAYRYLVSYSTVPISSIFHFYRLIGEAVSIDAGNHSLVDQFEWDLSEEQNSPEVNIFLFLL